jgi:preprotein translocase subunit Sec61beta
LYSRPASGGYPYLIRFYDPTKLRGLRISPKPLVFHTQTNTRPTKPPC